MKYGITPQTLASSASVSIHHIGGGSPFPCAVASQSAALVDLDPQASDALWGDRRGRSPFVGAVPAARLEAALGAADLALVPLHPGLFDIAALDATARLCTLASLPFAVVLNHVPPRGRTTDLAEVAPARIGARVIRRRGLLPCRERRPS